jgi:hypothetical protein
VHTLDTCFLCSRWFLSWAVLHGGAAYFRIRAAAVGLVLLNSLHAADSYVAQGNIGKAWMNRAAPAPGKWQAFIGHCALRDPQGKHAFF